MCPRTIGNPRVLAYLEPDCEVVNQEHKVSYWHLSSINYHRRANASRPRGKPTRLIVNAISREMLLTNESNYFSMCG
jgi:hypothetical protein